MIFPLKSALNDAIDDAQKVHATLHCMLLDQ